MKKIEVVIESDSFNAVHDALRDAKIGVFQVVGLKAFDTSALPQASYRGVRYPAGRECVMLLLIVGDHKVNAAVDAIRQGLDEIGEGHADLSVQPVENALHLKPSVWTRTRVRG